MKKNGFGKCNKCGKVLKLKQLYSYVDGNNGAITKNSKSYCAKCYNIIYRDRWY